MVHFDTNEQATANNSVEELKGKLGTQFEDEKLMHSVLQSDKKTIDDGNLVTEAIDQGIGAFTSDLLMEQLVKNFSMAKNLYGKKLLKLITGYNPDYIDKNIKIPEFQRELSKNIEEKFSELKDKNLITKEGILSEKGYELASLTLYIEELDHLASKDFFGEKTAKELSENGEKSQTKRYSKDTRYRDIDIKKSVKTAIRRNHKKLSESDLKAVERKSKGNISIIYALDASGSMKGKKIKLCKKAGIALAYKAIDDKNKVGLIVFGTDIKNSIAPTGDFIQLLKEITKIRASMETNMTKTIEKSIELFPKNHTSKHLILITDAMPTVGTEKDVLKAAAIAKANNITISLIGIGVKEAKLAKQITEVGEGRFYTCKNIDNLDNLVLEDYYQTKKI